VLGSGVAPDPAIVNEEDDVDGAPEAPDAPQVASGIRHLPLDAEPESRGCASSLARSPGSRPWLAAATGLALLAWRLRRRSSL
jgi:MYXO-CTERM domain-containing protein